MDQQKCPLHVNPKTERCLSGHNWKTFRSQVTEAPKAGKEKMSSKENSQQNPVEHKDQHARKATSERHDQMRRKRKSNDIRKTMTEQEREMQHNIENGIVKHAHEKKMTKYVAMDCEMVGIGDGSENMVARVSIVNKYGYCIYDKYVKPRERVQDYRSAISGVYPHHLESGVEFNIVQREVAEILKGKILVGHSIKHDLSVLHLSHSRKHIRDTSMYKPFRQVSKGNTPGLKKLVLELLGREIQIGEHNSIQDARATMQLYMLYRTKWESEIFNRRK